MPHASTVHVALLDDDPLLCREFVSACSAWREDPALKATTFEDKNNFLASFRRTPPEIALIDIHLKEGEAQGLAIIQELRARYADLLIVVLSQDLSKARSALQVGADDFILKRSAILEVLARLANTYTLWKKRFATPATSASQVQPIATTMQRIAARIPGLITSAVTSVHVFGESGTGKEVVADAFAAAMPAQTPFVKVNCAALSESLLERELFGHVKGSYTGALRDQAGFIEAASGGWIFLDEVQSLPLSAQAALLRALGNHEIVRVGATSPIRVDIRVLSAANEPLANLVKAGSFRNDLWQRLREVVIELPPLRERPAELPDMIRHFCQTERGGPYTMNAEAEAILMAYDWHEGNVRELRNCIRAMTETHVNRSLSPLSIPAWLKNGRSKPQNSSSQDEGYVKVDRRDGADFATMEDRLLLAMLEAAVTKQSSASMGSLAKDLGLPKSTLASKIKALNSRYPDLSAKVKALLTSKDRA